jgi:hypothetical protein
MSAWTAWDRRQRTFAIVAVAVLVGSIAYAVVVRNVLLGDRGTTALGDIGEAVAALLAATA